MVALVALLAVIAGLLQEGARRFLAQHALPTGAAEWIWAADRHRATRPFAFWAFRDFELEELPAPAHVLVAADESYLLYVNGHRVGSGPLRSAPDGGALLERYEVSSELRAGPNRLAVELRTSRGAGGLLLALLDTDRDRPLVVSDSSWRVVARAHPGVLQAWLPASEGASAFSWGVPPTGRWGRPATVVPRPAYAQATGEPWGRRPVAPRRLARGRQLLQMLLDRERGGEAAGETRESVARPAARPAARPGEPGPVPPTPPVPLVERLPWEPVGAPGPRLPFRLSEDGGTPTAGAGTAVPGLGPVVLFDWGREVEGYLNLQHRSRSGQPSGLLLVGSSLPPLAPEAGETVITVAGAAAWRDVVPRRFRYALVLGVEALEGAWVEPVDGALLERLPPPAAAPGGRNSAGGVRWIEPPPLETPVQHEVRRKLQGLAGGARGEGL